MPRAMTTRNLFDKKVKKLVTFSDPKLAEVIGEAEMKGCWLVWGIEKNGKTGLTLQLTKDLSYNQKGVYISAEEGTDKSFKDAVRRSGITTSHRILWEEYMPLEEIIEKYSKPRTVDIIIIDNITVYRDEFKRYGGVKKFIDDLGKLVVFVAHEERGDASTAAGRDAKKWAKVIFHIVGLTAIVASRYVPAGEGEIIIDENGAALYWGDAEK